MKHNIIGLTITAIAAFTFSAGGHSVLGASMSTVDNDHHHAEHAFGATSHSEHSECHSSDAQVLPTVANGNVQVILAKIFRTYVVERNITIQKPIAYSLREKVPLFERANNHTTTLAQRV